MNLSPGAPAAGDLAIIARVPLLSGLPGPDRAALIARLEMIEAPKRGPLFAEQDPAAAFFIVVSGWVRLFHADAAGGEADVGLFGPGDSFGEAAMFLGGRYPASAQAAEPARLARMSLSDMRALLEARPALAMSMLGSMSLHLHRLVARLAADRLHSADKRLAAYILARAREVEGGAARFRLPYDKAVLAGALGMAPEALSRAFAALRPWGVEVDGRLVRVGDPARLEDFLT